MKQPEETYRFSVRILLLLAAGVSYLIYFLVYHVFRYRHSVILANLSRSFPDKSEKQIKAYAKAYYMHLADLVVEPIVFILVDSEVRARLANYDNLDLVDDYYSRSENILAFSSHCGNWEYLINIPEVMKFKGYTAYTPLSNRFFDEYILKLRSLFGVYLIPKQRFYRAALAVLQNSKDPAIVVVISDQRPAPGSNKHLLNFMDQPTHVQMGAERLGIASGAAVFFIESVKTRRFHYRYTFHLITENAAGCLPMDITVRYYELLEQNILRSPAHWLWSHKRWKPVQSFEMQTT